MRTLKIFTAGIFLLASCMGSSRSDESLAKDSMAQGASMERTDSIQQSPASSPNLPFPYDLSHPDSKYKMPHELVEISAITVYKKSKLVCAEDEDGLLFIYDMKKEDVKRPVSFGKKGDYEGVANVHDTIYVLSSNGNLHQVLYFNSPEQHTNVFKTSLSKDNNTEGLCYDSLHNRLLIACKNNPGTGEKNIRAVYAFDLKSMQLLAQPVFKISLDELKNFLVKTDSQRLVADEMKNLFDPAKGDATFQPSEISINPLSNEVYLISTVGKLMVVLDPSGKIKMIEPMNGAIFKQPEGLCFQTDGTMYISDEGRSGHGNILEFKYHPDAH